MSWEYIDLILEFILYCKCTLNVSPDVPDFLFFSRMSLLTGLLAKFSINDVNMDNLCSFREYCQERAENSYLRMEVEERLAENEIGGVILGSLSAGLKRRPLNREEYLKEKRSNITNNTQYGMANRMAVYNVFEKYRDWKLKRDAYDMNDVVLLLLKQPMAQIFDSGKHLPCTTYCSHCSVFCKGIHFYCATIPISIC